MITDILVNYYLIEDMFRFMEWIFQSSIISLLQCIANIFDFVRISGASTSSYRKKLKIQ
jgi:hypothetical protein